MGSMTENYKLHQWEAGDNFLRTDFNEDNAKIEEALTELAGKTEMVFGTYTGNGATITLGFKPRAVYVCTQSGMAGVLNGSEYCYGGLALPGYPVTLSGISVVAITSTGFKVTGGNSYVRINNNGNVYCYFAAK